MKSAKTLLFARWISTCYADEHLDEKKRYTDNENFDKSTAISVLNREDGYWWKKQFEHFNDVVWSNYLKNGSAKSAKEFLKDIKVVLLKPKKLE